MYIIWFSGGLGNQMFQYCLYHYLSSEGYSVYADTSFFRKEEAHEGLMLPEVFDIKLNLMDEDKLDYLIGINSSKLMKIFKRVPILRKIKFYREKKPFSFDEKMFNFKDVYLRGYWQSTKYIEKYESEIRNIFTFKKFRNRKNILFSKKIENNNSVSIHVRRGDFFKNKKRIQRYGNICTNSYYKKAINIIKHKINDPIFLVFSDDIDWAKQNFTGSNFIFVDWNKGKSSYRDMHLMSLCKHNIIANSTFSWWGAWLNKNENKVVITPSKMNNKHNDFSQLFPDDWIKIE